MPVQITCKGCGATLEVPPSRVGRKKFCTRTCYGKWMSANLTGEQAIRWGVTHSEETRRRLSEAQTARGLKGPKNPRWTGGRFLTRGYVMVKLDALPPEERAMVAPMATASTRGEYLAEHRLVAARMLGRPLTSDEHVHHMNGHKADNRPENLEIHSGADHKRSHVETERKLYRLRAENRALRDHLSSCCGHESPTPG